MTWTAISTADNLQFVADDGDPEGTYYCYLTKEIGAPSYSFTFRGAKNVVLCLNGHTITGAEDSSKPVITVEEGKTFTLCDCGGEGQIIQVSQYSQGGVKVEGGTITRTAASSTDMIGVCVSGGTEGETAYTGTFNMLGGEITGNTAAGSGGGVYVSNGIGSIGKFTMSGGEISGNTADSYGGGVYVTPYNSTFTMSGDVTITGNKVCVADNNVYLPSNKTITIGAALGTGAKIGVITSGDPTSGNPIQIATDATNEQLDYTKIFTPDVKDKGYTITKDGATLYLSTHEHSWEYSVGADDVTTISATCKDTTCTSRNGGMVTISKPRHTVYGDGKTADATVAKNTWVADAVSEITYKNYTGDNTPLPAAPTDAGRYIASITAGGKTAYVFYEIAKATPTANDFNFSVPTSNLTYDGTAKTATVEPKEGITGMGTAIGITYYKDTDSTIRNRQS